MSDQNQQSPVDKLLEEGMTLYGLGKIHEAAAVWKRVLDLSPTNPTALEYLEIVKEEIGDAPAPEAAAAPPPPPPPPPPAPPPQARPEPAPPQPAQTAEKISDSLQVGIRLIKEGQFERANEGFKKLAAASPNDSTYIGYEALARTHRFAKYNKVVGSLSAVPQIVMGLDNIKQIDLSKEAGFVLSLVDGMISFEDIITLSRMDKLDSMGHLTQLIEKGVIRS